MNLSTIKKRNVWRWLKNPQDFARWLACYDYAAKELSPLPASFIEFFPNVRRMRSFELPIPHCARQDRRFEEEGILLSSWDEVTLLYNYGLRYIGKTMLEIGSWVGWSTVGLALSGLRLVVVDPVFTGMAQGDACMESIKRANVADRIELVGGYSPQALTALKDDGRRWPLFFIDGDHEGDAPRLDTEACLEIAELDALILFHDLMRENLCEVLSGLGKRGWNVGVHYTANFIGVAWRGNLTPLTHTADPNIKWERIISKHWPHLKQFQRL